MDWITVELMGYSYYSQKGYRILIPLVNNEGYDFVVEKDGKYLKVNVKTAGLKDRKNKNSWSISLAGGARRSRGSREIPVKGKIDLYLVWLPYKQEFIELPGDFLSQGNSMSRNIPRILYK